ncbi:MAG: ABC transporter permease [Gemmatimonadales bacterium]
MNTSRLILKNAFRHRLRTVLTILGVGTAVMSFGLIRTIVTAWNYGVEASATNRMITRNRVSLIFPVSLADRAKIAKIPGVAALSWANWFGGVYGDPNDWKNFWPRIAVDPETYFSLYPEFVLPADQLAAFRAERNACVLGRKVAQQHGFKLGDVITMEGDIFPGRWEFVVRGIYTGRDQAVDETQMFFQWNYLYERVQQLMPGRPVDAGWYVLKVDNPNAMGEVGRAVDAEFQNSRAPTKTETEREFQQSFVSMSGAIITSLSVISFVIVAIILLVLANTIVMGVRERTREFAILKTIGFSSRRITGFIVGEAMVIAICGGLLGLLLTIPATNGFAQAFPTFFPVFRVAPVTIVLALGSALLAGVAAASLPALRAQRTSIATGLRTLT